MAKTITEGSRIEAINIKFTNDGSNFFLQILGTKYYINDGIIDETTRKNVRSTIELDDSDTMIDIKVGSIKSICPDINAQKLGKLIKDIRKLK